MDKRFSVRPWQSFDFFGTKRLLVELDRLTGSFHHQVWSKRVKTIWNCFDLIFHSFFALIGLFQLNHRSIVAAAYAVAPASCPAENSSARCLIEQTSATGRTSTTAPYSSPGHCFAISIASFSSVTWR